MYLRQKIWLSQLKACLQEATEADLEQRKQGKLVLVDLIDLNNSQQGQVKHYCIQKEFYDELFDANGRIRANDHPASNEISKLRHTVIPKRLNHQYAYVVKMLPENMPAETFCYAIDEYLGGEHIPCGIPVKFVCGKSSYAAYWMEDLRGYIQAEPLLSLSEVIEKHPERLSRIDKRSFTITLLRVLLTNPEDDKADDYFLEPFYKEDNNQPWYRLLRVDNERLFHAAETEAENKKNKKPLVKSIIYLLNQIYENDALDKEVLETFIQFDLSAFLQTILQRLGILQSQLKQLFVLDEAKKHYFKLKETSQHLNLRDTQHCWLLSAYSEKRIIDIRQRLHIMQAFAHLVLSYELPQPGRTLLGIIHYNLIDYYIDAFNKHYDSKKAGLVKERFEYLRKKFDWYQRQGQALVSGMGVTRVITASMGLLEELLSEQQIEAIYQDQIMSPTCSMGALKKQNNVDDVFDKTIIEKVINGEQIPNQVLVQFNPYQQTFLLTALQVRIAAINNAAIRMKNDAQRLQYYQHLPLKSLSLGLFRDILTPSRLSALIKSTKNYLEKLDISDCSDITQENIQEVLQGCRQLTHLTLNGLITRTNYTIPALDIGKSILDWNEFDLDLTHLSRLKHVSILNCTNAKKIIIRNYSHLNEFIIRNCPLTELQINLFNQSQQQGDVIDVLVLDDCVDLANNALRRDILDPKNRVKELIIKLNSGHSLIKNLQLNDDYICEKVFGNLLQFEKRVKELPYKEIISILCLDLQSENESKRQQAFDNLLKQTGKVELPFMKMAEAMQLNLRSKDKSTQEGAFDRLLKLEGKVEPLPYAKMFEALQLYLQSENERTREGAFDRLLKLEGKVERLPYAKMSEALQLNLQSESGWTREGTFDRLLKLEGKVKPLPYAKMAEAMYLNLQCFDPIHRHIQAFYSLCMLGDKVEKLYEKIVELLCLNLQSNKDKAIRRLAFDNLFELKDKIELPFAKICEVLLLDLQSEDQWTRYQTVECLLMLEGKVERLYEKIEKVLCLGLQSKDESKRQQAFDDLLKLEAKIKLPFAHMAKAMQLNLQSKSTEIRKKATENLLNLKYKIDNSSIDSSTSVSSEFSTQSSQFTESSSTYSVVLEQLPPHPSSSVIIANASQGSMTSVASTTSTYVSKTQTNYHVENSGSSSTSGSTSATSNEQADSMVGLLSNEKH